MTKQHLIDRFVVADEHAQTRNLVGDVLRGAGFTCVVHARDGRELLAATEEYFPRVVITTSRLPLLSGLEFTRLIRAGHNNVPRETSIIAMTDTPTRSFVNAARTSGVDEMLVRPFSGHAVLLRVKSVLERPRAFIDTPKYVGPCRRRKMVEEYDGPLRRTEDPVGDMAGARDWESSLNRQAMRLSVNKISELALVVDPTDRRQLRGIYQAVKETQSLADSMHDPLMAAAARSLGRYVSTTGTSGRFEVDVLAAHVDAMQTMSALTSAQHDARRMLTDSLQQLVDKKLGRSLAA